MVVVVKVIILPSIDALVADAYEAVINMAHTDDSEDDSDLLEAARGIQRGIENWCYDTGLPESVIPRALIDMALQRVLQAGWLAREAMIQESYRIERPMTDGAARYEALEGI